MLLALLFTMEIQAAFFGPLKYAILPDLLGPEELLLGNALVEAGTFIAILLGTIAGMLIATRHGGSRGADGIAASGGVFVVPLYTLLQAATDHEHGPAQSRQTTSSMPPRW